MTRCGVRVNGRSASTSDITVNAGDVIELVAGITLIVEVEMEDDLTPISTARKIINPRTAVGVSGR
jgi:hypothetical protein